MRHRFPFRLRMLMIMLGMCWLLAVAFIAFQYHREKEFKADILDTRLQMHNDRIIDDLRGGEDIASIVSRISSPTRNLRITLIDSAGRVLYDSHSAVRLLGGHNSRPEVIAARATGSGHAIARISQSDETSYFYSARLADNGMVVRSAAPYTHSLAEVLSVDRTIIFILLAITLVVSAIGLLATRKISVSIQRLSLFAQKAEKGERIYEGYSFPDDELGDIAANIVRLYVQREEQHRQTIALQQDRARLKRQLTNNINHELKTPVASILLTLDLLEDHSNLPPEKRAQLISRIRANAERLSALLRDVSTLTRMEEAPQLIRLHPLDVSALVRDIADEARLRTHMAITVDMPPQLMVSADQNLLESVFRNIIDNAIAHSGATELCITADDRGNFIVRDNGRGVPPVHLPHIFERFYRVDSGRSRSTGGTGLGLAIVRNALAAHNSVITASNTPGLTFSFTLPPYTTSSTATKDKT